MKIEQVVYDKMFAGHMATHATWHAARIPESLVPFHDRDALRAARLQFPEVVDWNSRSAGRQFLEFHREMIRHYKFIRLDELGLADFPTWPELPPFLTDRLPPRYLAACIRRIDELVTLPSLEDLGNFIEAAGGCHDFGSNIHNILHGHLALIEVTERPGDPDLKETGMDDPSTAHYNKLFWSLHEWIDRQYSRWLCNHGLPNVTSPLSPARGTGHTHAKPIVVAPSLQAILRARFNPQ